MQDRSTAPTRPPTRSPKFSDQRVTATVGTLNEDGSVHLAYVIFLHEDGKLYFETSSVTRKARNVLSRPQATLLVQGSASTGRNLMVAAEGTARVIEGPEAAGDQPSAAREVREGRCPRRDRSGMGAGRRRRNRDHAGALALVHGRPPP